MPPRLSDVNCCCQMIFIYHGVYLIALHCFLQGVFGIGLVRTSSYQSVNISINYATMASNMCLIPTGIFIFWVKVYEKWRAAIFAGVLIIIFTLFNLGTAIAYFYRYVKFKANSILDKIFFWGDGDWVSSDELLFTLWHILALYLILINGLFLYYSYVLFKISQCFRRKILKT